MFHFPLEIKETWNGQMHSAYQLLMLWLAFPVDYQGHVFHAGPTLTGIPRG